ncbi:hypothetical protein [Pseudodesulfovibrio methanolicus]|uniref:PE-PGRS family protein n=1 Tax=Pseudodesulfovibrio methanolicus TaxID=3126690 RepID=A0ABZ2J5Q4_9BACT
MAWLKRTLMAGRGPGNWFGDGSDGDIRVGSAGAEQSFDGGFTWSTIPGWTIVGSVVLIPSVQDGDMVLVNACNLTVDSGYTLTVMNRCRGLLVYCTGIATISGKALSMTARGCHANPADSTTTSDTPVAPSDGNAVPAEGIILRRLAHGQTDTHTGVLGLGLGLAMLASEANQPIVDGDGLVIAIPRIGGAGAPYNEDIPDSPGYDGSARENAPGGGGGGGNYGANSQTPPSADGTCYAGGPGVGGANAAPGLAPGEYGGPGSAGVAPFASTRNGCGGGAGNPGGLGIKSGEDGEDGVGGLLILIARAIVVVGFAQLAAEGSPGGSGPSGVRSGGGGSGAGAIFVFCASLTGSITPLISGGPGGTATMDGGKGGDGHYSLHFIDP